MFKSKRLIEKYKTGAEQTRTSKKNLEVKSGVMERTSSAGRSHPPCVLCRNREVRGQLGD